MDRAPYTSDVKFTLTHDSDSGFVLKLIVNFQMKLFLVIIVVGQTIGSISSKRLA